MHRRIVRSYFLLFAGTLLLGACAPIIAEEPVQASLAPMEKPNGRQVGDISYILHNGTEEFKSEVVARDDKTISFANSRGCSYTVSTMGFAPSLKFDNCDGNSGTQEITRVTGSPWPLTIGQSWSYAFTGEGTQGNTWEGERECEVEAEVRVTAPIGTFDSFKVVCTDPWRVRTYYVAPEIERIIVYLVHNLRRNHTERYELIRGVSGTA